MGSYDLVLLCACVGLLAFMPVCERLHVYDCVLSLRPSTDRLA